MRFAARTSVQANGGGEEIPRSGLALEEPELFVRSCINRLTALCVLYGFDPEGWSPSKTIEHWLFCSTLVGDHMSFVKWKLAAFYASNVSIVFGETQEVAASVLLDAVGGPVDVPHILLGGKAYRWMRCLKKNDPCRWQSFLVSVLMSKTGMERPGVLMREAKLRDTFVTLTEPRPVPLPEVLVPTWGAQDEYPDGKVEFHLNVETVCAQIERTVIELFHDEIYSWEDQIEPFFPSTSANYINSRKLGGAVGVLMRDPDLWEGLNKLGLLEVEVKKGRYGELLTADISKLREQFEVLINRVKVKAMDELAQVELVGLIEAFKIRVISKGPPYLMTILKPLQKKMWSVMMKHPAFELIGKPVSAEHVQKRLGKSLLLGQGYLSVDYKDATNQLEAFCSNAACDALSKTIGLDEDTAVLFKRSLTGHLISNPTGILGGFVFELPQLNGQLMGSVTSFPILCIINAAICRWSLELAQKNVVTLRDALLTINGDDAVMRINEFGMLMWQRISRFCGLAPSVGKVYYSRRFLNINSTTYLFHPQGWESISVDLRKHLPREAGDNVAYYTGVRTLNFELVKYVNLGLLYSMTRSSNVGCDREDDGFVNASAVHELVDSAPWDLREKVLAKWIYLNDVRLKRVHLPWFIPSEFGGLGLPEAGRFIAVDRDRRIARKIYEHPSVYRIPGILPSAPWQVWKLASAALPKPSLMSGEVMLASKEQCSWNRLVGYMCVALLFTSQIQDLYAEQGKENRNSLRIRARVWKRAMSDVRIPMPEPFRVYPRIYNHLDHVYVNVVSNNPTDVTTVVAHDVLNSTRLRALNPWDEERVRDILVW